MQEQVQAPIIQGHLLLHQATAITGAVVRPEAAVAVATEAVVHQEFHQEEVRAEREVQVVVAHLHQGGGNSLVVTSLKTLIY